MLPNELPNETGTESPQEPTSPVEATPAAAPAIPAPAQNFATRDDLMAVVDSVKAIAAAVQQGVATRTPAPVIPSVSDEDIMNAINEGKPTGALKRLTEEIKQSLIAEHIAPLRQQGMASIAALTKDAARASVDMPYFGKFEKQIDQLVANVPLEQRADPNTYRTAYAIVAGQNMTAIIKEEVEKAMRTANAGDGGQVPNGSPRPAGAGAGIPSVLELLGADADSALKAQGWTPDQYAQKVLRASTWAEAATRIAKFNQEHPTNA